MSPSIISIQPSIENCDPIKKYQKSTPIRYSLQENPILYGGGRKWLITCSNDEFLSGLVGSDFNITQQTDQDEALIDLFVLNTSFIIWFNALEKGLEVSYLDIPAHAVRKNSANQLELYIQMSLNDHEEFIEFTFRPKYLEDDRYFNDYIEKLFTFEYFGQNKGNKMIFNTFNAIGKCSCFHNLPDQDQDQDDSIMESDSFENEEILDINVNDLAMDDGEDEDITTEFYDNSGNADDLNFKNNDIDEGKFGKPLGSGVMVSIYNDEINTKTRNRDDLMSDDTDTNKKLKS